MEIYFYDENNRYIGHRQLREGEQIPPNTTTNEVILIDGEEAHYQNGAWIISQIATEKMYYDDEKTETQRLSTRLSAVEETTAQILNLI